MKAGKFLLILTFFIFLLSPLNRASAEDLYEPDLSAMQEDFKMLEPLEAILEQSPQMNLEALKHHHSIPLENINLAMPGDSSGGFGQKFGKFDLPAFGIGFCCWPYGVAYLLVKGQVSKEEKRSYCLGVITSLAGGVVVNIIDSGGFGFGIWDDLVNAFSVF